MASAFQPASRRTCAYRDLLLCDHHSGILASDGHGGVSRTGDGLERIFYLMSVPSCKCPNSTRTDLVQPPLWREYSEISKTTMSRRMVDALDAHLS